MHDDINIRSPSFLLGHTSATCPQCAGQTPLFALAVPPGHVVLQLDDDVRDGRVAVDTWEIAPQHAFLFRIAYLPLLLANRLERLAPGYRLDPGDEDAYWRNHCEGCAAGFDDHDLFCEPGGAFLPADAATAGLIELTPIDEPFAAVAAGYACEPQFFESCSRF